MTIYEKDTAASAVVLYENMDTYYEYDNELFFRVVNRYFVRIKILTNDGLSQADQQIYRYLGATNRMSDQLFGLTGFTYNLVNGKIEKTKLSKEHIFEEKTSEHLSRTKFAFQSVKPGSVIEYKYELSSPRYWDLNDYYFQRSIPVKYSKYSLKIPEYFYFKKETRGTEPILPKESRENQTIVISGRPFNFTANTYEFVTKDLPGLKDESYVWSIRDFLAKVTFELHSFVIPGIVHETYSNTWERVDEKLLPDSDFGKQFNHKFFKDKLPTLLTAEMTDTEKVRAIYNMVKKEVKWNEENTFWVKNPREALKKGLGTSAEINAILISALREAGFNAYPIAMRLRHTGRIPITHPTIDNFNYFIAAVDIDGKPVYMDAVTTHSDLNVMPTSRLADFSRSIREEKQSAMVNLTNISKSSGTTVITAMFNENGELSGKVQEAFSSQLGYELRNRISQSKDEQEFFDKIAAAQNIEISSYLTKDIANTDKRVTLEYDFTKKDVVTGDEYIYFNPLVFPLYEESPFKAEERKLPVEFSYPYDKRYVVTIDIPEGYEVEALPTSTKVTINDKNDIVYQYLITEYKETGKIAISLQFALNRIIYLQNEYQSLRDFFLYLATSNNEQVVLKKIAQ